MSYRLIMAFFVAFLLVSCSDSSSSGQTTIPTYNISGIVLDENNNSIANASVVSDGVSSTTDSNGAFLLSNVPVNGDRYYVEVVKNGFFKRGSGGFITGLTGDINVRIVLTVKILAGTIGSGGGTVSSTSSSITFPSNSFSDSNVSIYIGDITPGQSNFSDAMPGGDFSADNQSGESGVLTSFGAITVVAEDQNQNEVDPIVQFDACINIPTHLQASAPATIPVWRLDNSSRGTWQEVATGTLIGGTQYCFVLNGLKNINCDIFSRSTIVKGEVCVSGTRIPNTTVRVGDLTTQTNENGEYSILVPSNVDIDIISDFGSALAQNFPPNTTNTVNLGSCSASTYVLRFCAENYERAACEILAGSYTVLGSSGWEIFPAGSCASLIPNPNNTTEIIQDYTSYGATDPISCYITVSQ